MQPLQTQTSNPIDGIKKLAELPIKSTAQQVQTLPPIKATPPLPPSQTLIKKPAAKPAQTAKTAKSNLTYSPLTPVKQSQMLEEAVEEEMVEEVNDSKKTDDADQNSLTKPKSWKEVKTNKNNNKKNTKTDKGNFYSKLNKSKWKLFLNTNYTLL